MLFYGSVFWSYVRFVFFEMVETDGGVPGWVIFVAGAIAGGIVYDVAKTVYVAAVEKYVEACGEGLYEGQPKGR